jgi:DnaJ-class molecular chaperone
MPTRSFYSIIGVPEDADQPTIKRAYRRLVFSAHPHTGESPDPVRFRGIEEAYSVLSDEQQRRAYDWGLRHQPRAAQSIQRGTPIEPLDIPGDFATTAPSISEFLDHVAQNFFGFHRKSLGPFRHLGVEIVLSRDEAHFGCRVPMQLPCYETCGRCFGSGDLGWGLCPLCHGLGGVEGKATIALDIPPMTRDASRFEVALGEAGISNLVLDVTVVVTANWTT